MSEQRPWHRLFGLSLMDFFRGMPVTVEMEKDLSQKLQRLDVVIIHKGAEPLSCRMPDGLEDLAAHNLDDRFTSSPPVLCSRIRQNAGQS